jgi:putative lipoprotein
MHFVFVFALWGAPPERPAPSGRDPWIGHDKLLHFVASAAVQGAAHAAFRARGADYGAASRGAAAITLTVGVSKELWDRHRGGDASLRDLAWDVVGGTTGAVVVRQADR